MFSQALPHEGQERSPGTTVLDDLGIAANDAAGFFSAPLRFSGREWLATAGFAATTLGLMALDDDIRAGVGRNTSSSLNGDLWDVPTGYGNVLYANAFGAATYLTGLAVRSESIRTTGRLLLESLTFAEVTTITIRFVMGRSRPYAGEGPWKFRPFSTNNETQSFPSGHATIAFALSTVLAERIDTWLGRTFFYGIATLTAAARVVNNQHWDSDVFVGAASGIAAGLFVVGREAGRESGHPSGFHVQPTTNGIALYYVFR